ncbi:MAG: FG-GAP-like repeat-containing protein [Bryobacteraceae bacterium]|nr:FG-GAP-like repeat-containing protein [Bryobacteraceae bacterium]
MREPLAVRSQRELLALWHGPASQTALRAIRLTVFTAAIVGGGLAWESDLQRGAEAFRKQDFPAAEAALRQAVSKNPSALGWKLLGLTYSAQEKYAAAEAPLRRACDLNPREDKACYYLGRVLYSLMRYAEAEKAFGVAQRMQPAERGRILRGLGLAQEALGKDAEAERSYRDAIRAGEGRARVEYGMFLYNHGRAVEAIPLLRDAGAKGELTRVEAAVRAAGSLPVAKQTPATTGVTFRAMPLPMIVRNGATGAKHLPETMLGGVAVFDFDGDGWPDIFVANGAELPSQTRPDKSWSNRLFRNNRDGTFTDVTEPSGLAGSGYSMGVAAADFDNDGRTDLFVAGLSANKLYWNRGDGKFDDVTDKAGVRGDGRWSVAAGWFDYDRDGRLDLFVVRYVEWVPRHEPFCGDRKANYRTYCHPEHYKALSNAVYHNEGNGNFRDVSVETGVAAHRAKGMGVAFGDFDGDGWPDVFVANDSVPNFLFHNLQGRGFDEVALAAGVALNSDGAPRSSMGVDFRDYDNDGREDLFITDLSNERFLLFRNVGNGEFADAAGVTGIAAASLPWTGWSTGLYDFNNDGSKDIFVSGGHVMDNAERTSGRQSKQPNLLFLNRGKGGTFALQQLPGEALHRGAAFGDFDRDGRIDVVVTALNQPPEVLWNTTAPAGHWIGLRLTGTKSNRDGIGARVHVVTASGEQWNRVTTSVGYSGSSHPAVHFGLGSDKEVKLLEIDWPSGLRQIVPHIRVDGWNEVNEGH